MIKLLHLSDLHIGKIVNEINMLSDQKYILNEILDIIKKEKPNGVLIAGDVYDKSVPSAEAVELYDNFITQLAELDTAVYIISGNHDSPERLGFCSRLIRSGNIFVDAVFNGKANKHTLCVNSKNVNIYTLPFIKPANVKAFYGGEINDYTQAVKTVLENTEIDKNVVNILVAHQFVTGTGTAVRVDSENVSVGGVDNVDAAVFADFDYVALGHLHTRQSAARNVAYCGTPLKYSSSECSGKKCAVMVEIDGKDISTREIPLVPMRDMRIIKGTLRELTDTPQGNTDDYIFAVLTDEAEPIDPMGSLRSVYPNIMSLRFDNRRSKSNADIQLAKITNKTPVQLFAEFYEMQNNIELTKEQADLVNSIFACIEEEQ